MPKKHARCARKEVFAEEEGVAAEAKTEPGAVAPAMRDILQAAGGMGDPCGMHESESEAIEDRDRDLFPLPLLPRHPFWHATGSPEEWPSAYRTGPLP